VSASLVLAVGIGVAAVFGAGGSPNPTSAEKAAKASTEVASAKVLRAPGVPEAVPPTTVVPGAATVPPTTVAQAQSAAASATATDIAASSPEPATTPSRSREVSSNDGGLTATLTATTGAGTPGTVVSFVLSVSDSTASGPVGPTSLNYGDGQPVPETGLAASCHAGASSAPVTDSFDYSHTYGASGTYTVSVTVSSPCSSEQVVLALPITVTAS